MTQQCEGVKIVGKVRNAIFIHQLKSIKRGCQLQFFKLNNSKTHQFPLSIFKNMLVYARFISVRHIYCEVLKNETDFFQLNRSGYA